MYAQEGTLVENDLTNDPRVIGSKLLSGDLIPKQRGDIFPRNFIRHDANKLATELMKIVEGA